MTDMQFNFLVRVAQTEPAARQELLTNPDYQTMSRRLGSVRKEVLEVLLGSRYPGNVAKAWLSLVKQAAAQRDTNGTAAQRETNGAIAPEK